MALNLNNRLKTWLTLVSIFISTQAISDNTSNSCKKILDNDVHEKDFYDTILGCYWSESNQIELWLNEKDNKWLNSAYNMYWVTWTIEFWNDRFMDIYWENRAVSWVVSSDRK